MKNLIYLASRVFRRITAFNRRLPDFIIIGASKGGTSSLFHYLSQHPQIKASSKKEVQYYGSNYKKGESWYRSHFPLNHTKSKYLTGEATPYYLFNPVVPELVKKHNPGAKFIVLLRNPVDRAYSHYQMQVRNKIENYLEFDAAIKVEASRTFGEHEKISKDPFYTSENHLRFAYLERGKYGEQLKRWFAVFTPNQFLVLQSEYFFTNPQAALKEIYNFLDIKCMYPSGMQAKNVGTYAEIDPQLRVSLQDYYKEDKELLMELLGKKFNYFW